MFGGFASLERVVLLLKHPQSKVGDWGFQPQGVGALESFRGEAYEGGGGGNAVEKRNMIIGVTNISELAQALFVFALTAGYNW